MKIGVKWPRYAKYNESNGNETYTDGAALGKAIKIDYNPNVPDNVAYADDDVAEEDHGVIEGDLSLDTTDVSDENYSTLLGHSTNSDGEIVANEADNSIYVGFAFYARKIVNGVSHWRAIFFPKVIFTEPSESMETKKKDLAFGSHTLPGKIRKNLAGDWKIEKTFDTEAEAQTWVNTKCGITSGSSGGSGGSGGSGSGSGSGSGGGGN